MDCGPAPDHQADDCPELFSANDSPSSDDLEITIYPLAGRHALLAAVCYYGASNESLGYWQADLDLLTPPRLVGIVADITGGVESGKIMASAKDCAGYSWSQERWVWNGQVFVHVRSSRTGLCRPIEAGGAWDLPALVSAMPWRIHGEQMDCPDL